MSTNVPTIRLAIFGQLHLIGDAYAEALPVAQTRIVQRKGRQVHKGLRTRVTRGLGAGAGKAIRLGAPRQPQLNPRATVWSKLYRRGRNREYIDVVNLFESAQRINPRTSLYIPTEAAARMAGERWRRRVSPEMFRGELVFLPSDPGTTRTGRRRRVRHQRGVLIHRRTKEVLFVVTGPVRIKRKFQPFAAIAERQTRNTADLIAKELDAQMAGRMRRISA